MPAWRLWIHSGPSLSIICKKKRHETESFLGAFAKLRQATIRSVMSACLSVGRSVCPHETTWLLLDGFPWSLTCEDSSKLCQVWLKPNKNNGYFTWRPIYIYDILLRFSRSGKCFREKLCKVLKHVLISNNFPPPRKLCLFEIMCNKHGAARQATDNNII
jgi:hypothetical protein